MIQPYFKLAVLGAFVVENHILLVRTIFGGEKWQLPGGFVEKGEAVEGALIREINEELGIKPKILHPVGIYIREWNGDMAIIFRIDIDEKHIKLDLDEIVEYRLFPLSNPPKITSRTQKIIQDIMDQQSSRVVSFSDLEDSGHAL